MLDSFISSPDFVMAIKNPPERLVSLFVQSIGMKLCFLVQIRVSRVSLAIKISQVNFLSGSRLAI
jgi:hypothetical protein